MTLPLPAAAAWSPAGWRERWLAWRDARLTSAGFRRAAARFWPTRPLARRRAAELFDLMAGFVYSQVLLGCVRLDLFERLRHGPCSVGAIASFASLPPERAQRLLDAACALRLLEQRGAGPDGPRYGLGVLGAPMVDQPGLAALVEHHALLYADLADPLALLREPATVTALGRYWAYADSAPGQAPDAEAVSRYSALMTASQTLVADEVLSAYDLGRHHTLLDIGGGEGGFAFTAAQRHPRLQVRVFDLPAVAARAHVRLAALGLQARAQALGGDFRCDALPHGADLISLVRVVHDHDDGTVRALLRAAHAALPPGGTLLLAEPMAATPGAQAMGDAYFGLYLLAMGRGRPRTPEALRALLREAGFTRIRTPRTDVPLQVQVIVARRPDKP